MDQTLTSALADVRGVKVDEQAAVRAHAIRPSHVQDVVERTRRGEADILFPFPPSTIFDVDGFGKAIHAKLKDAVAGYVLQLRHHGKTIYTLQWNWAKRPWDGAGSVDAGCAHARGQLQQAHYRHGHDEAAQRQQLAYDTPIVGFLPSYWAKGPHVNTITFRQLMTHTSGLGIAGKSDSDFELMKNRVAAGGAATPAPLHVSEHELWSLPDSDCHDQWQYRARHDLQPAVHFELERSAVGSDHNLARTRSTSRTTCLRRRGSRGRLSITQRAMPWCTAFR